MSGIEQITEWRVLPTGMTTDDINTHSFAVNVKYRGEPEGKHGGGFSINHCGAELSRGGSWGWPERFRRWQFRWETFEEAQAVARDVVDAVKVNGRTFAEWQASR